MYKFKGFIIKVSPVFESTESRLARKDWQSKVLSYSYIVRPAKGGKSFEGEGFETEEQAEDEAIERILAILDSL